MSAIELMFPPFVACMMLVAIHGYFGLHVIARGVIFVDLALAQMAALGATTGLLFQIMPDTTAAHLFSIGAVAAGAAILAATRVKHKTRVPQEAIIGIVYVAASAAAILVADKAPRGADIIHDALVGSLLWITWPTIITDAVAYALIGGLLYLLHRRLWAISFAPDAPDTLRLRVRWWDFVFYLLFGITVTFSVPIAGVLLVFTFLVVPAVMAFMFSEQPGRMMATAWITGMLACTLGLSISYTYDLPTGPVVVCTFGTVLLGAALIRRLVRGAAAA